MPRDSSSLGADFLREQISLCRNYLNEVSHYLQDVLVEEAQLAQRLDSEEAAFQIRSSELLASDRGVAARPSIADRQAMIDTILRDEKHSIIRLQSEVRSLSHVKGVIRHRKQELDNTMSSLRLQASLLKDQLRTGSFYGDESERARGGRFRDPVDELDSADLEALVASTEEELNAERVARQPAPVPTDPADAMDAETLEALMSTSESDVAAGADTDAAIARFLEEPDDDLADLLASV